MKLLTEIHGLGPDGDVAAKATPRESAWVVEWVGQPGAVSQARHGMEDVDVYATAKAVETIFIENGLSIERKFRPVN